MIYLDKYLKYKYKYLSLLGGNAKYIRNNVNNICRNKQITNIIIFHYVCLDGFMSIYLLNKYLNFEKNTFFIPFSWEGNIDNNIEQVNNYLKKQNNIKNVNIYFVDIFNEHLCYNLIALLKVNNIFILDHHADKAGQLKDLVFPGYKKIFFDLYENILLTNIKNFVDDKINIGNTKNIFIISDLNINQTSFKSKTYNNHNIKYAASALVCKFLVYIDFIINDTTMKFIEIISDGDTNNELTCQIKHPYHILNYIVFNMLQKIYLNNRPQKFIKNNLYLFEKILNNYHINFDNINKQYNDIITFQETIIINIFKKYIDQFTIKLNLTNKTYNTYLVDLLTPRNDLLNELDIIKDIYPEITEHNKLKKRLKQIQFIIVPLINKSFKYFIMSKYREITNVFCDDNIVLIYLSKDNKGMYSLSLRCAKENNHLGIIGKLFYKKYEEDNSDDTIYNILTGKYGGGHIVAASHRRTLDEMEIFFNKKELHKILDNNILIDDINKTFLDLKKYDINKANNIIKELLYKLF